MAQRIMEHDALSLLYRNATHKTPPPRLHWRATSARFAEVQRPTAMALACLLACCNAPRGASNAAECAAACTPQTPAPAANTCPQETCVQTTTAADPNACSAPHLDANSLPPSGELRLGQAFISATVTGWDPGFCPRIPTVSWAMALAHAARIEQLQGIQVTPEQFLATAIKESTLGCDPQWQPCLPYIPAAVHDGCFQMTCSLAYAQMRQSYGARFAAAPCATLFGDHFETSALAKAYYDRFTWAVLQARDPNVGDFFAQARDPLALAKVLAYAYNQGVYEPGLVALFSTQRATCEAAPSLTNDGVQQGFVPSPCFPSPVGHDYAWAVGRVTAALQNPNGAVYDTQVAWSDVQHYLDRIAPLYPELTVCPGTSDAVHAAFDRVAAGAPSISFRHALGSVLDALLVALPAPETPTDIVPYAP